MTKRGKNSSFYHFRLQEISPDDNDIYLEYQYFKTAKEICESYNISRASLYRILNDPLAVTTIPFKLERIYLHTTAIAYMS